MNKLLQSVDLKRNLVFLFACFKGESLCARIKKDLHKKKTQLKLTLFFYGSQRIEVKVIRCIILDSACDRQ